MLAVCGDECSFAFAMLKLQSTAQLHRVRARERERGGGGGCQNLEVVVTRHGLAHISSIILVLHLEVDSDAETRKVSLCQASTPDPSLLVFYLDCIVCLLQPSFAHLPARGMHPRPTSSRGRAAQPGFQAISLEFGLPANMLDTAESIGSSLCVSFFSYGR